MSNILTGLPPFALTQAGVNVNGIMDATAEKVAFIGRITWEDADTTKSIRQISARLGAITVGTGTTFRVSIQNVDTSAGPPGVPDGTPDENWTALASALTANAVFTTGNLSADRSVSKGDLLAVVFDFSAFGATTSVVVNNVQAEASNHMPSVVLYTAAWAVLATTFPNCAFIFSDATRGSFEGATLISNTSAVDYNNATASSSSLDSGDERGTKWVPDAPGTIKALRAFLRIAGGTSDFDLAVYRGTTLIGSVSCEGNMITAAGSYSRIDVPLATPQRFDVGDLLYFVLKPTTANNVRILAIDFDNIDDLSLCFGGQTVSWAQRADATAWVENTGHTLRVGGIFPLGEFDTGIYAGAYSLSGEVLNGGTPVSGATVRVIDRVTGLSSTAITNGSGLWSLAVEHNDADRYAAYAEYENGGTKYCDVAYWAITAA